jgi:hypothetical protein
MGSLRTQVTVAQGAFDYAKWELDDVKRHVLLAFWNLKRITWIHASSFLAGHRGN